MAVKIDRTLPLVALSGGPAHGSSYYFGQVPAAPTCSGSDGLSGLETCIISGYGMHDRGGPYRARNGKGTARAT